MKGVARRSRSLDQRVDALIEAALAESGARAGTARAAHARDMIVAALRMLCDAVPEGDVKLVGNAVDDLERALRLFAPYEHLRKVAVFGGTNTAPGHPDWQQAHRFAEEMAQRGWMVITGAGPGIMQAAQGGAGRDGSFGVSIRLPYEEVNQVIAGDEKLASFKYFFTRKLAFVKNAHAAALFPGGFGTHDEAFEMLTLIQTGKSEMLPVVFVDAPGGSYWRDWAEYVDTHLLRRGLIAPDDVALFRVTDAPRQAADEIARFYRNYHSSRWVGDRLVLRVRQAPAADALAALGIEFSDLLRGGRIAASTALAEEGDDAPGMARLVLEPTRGRNQGRLRRVIDRLNDIVPGADAGASPATHQIVEQQPVG
jgi:uncharacterized protein (TIGR00730 family)